MRIIGLAFALTVAAAGCMTSDEGDQLKKDIEELKKRLAQKVQQTEEEQEKLKGLIEQATALLTRNSADVGAQVERLGARVAQLSGQVEVAQKNVSDLTRRVEELGTKNAPTPQAAIPENKDEHYRLATSKYSSGDQNEARRLFRAYLTRHAGDARTASAQLMLGHSYYAEQKYAPAITEYRKVIEEHKKSAAYPDALYHIGMSFYQLQFCGDAQLFLNELLKRFKSHAQAGNASKLLGTIRKQRGNRQVCKP